MVGKKKRKNSILGICGMFVLILVTSFLFENGLDYNNTSIKENNVNDEDSNVVIVKQIDNSLFFEGHGNITKSSYSEYNNSLSSVTSIHIKGSIKAIDALAFHDLNKIEEVNINAYVRYIYDRAFKDCINLEEVHFSSSPIIMIDDYAFAGCVNLEYINFPYTLREINNRAFQNCINLKSITLPKSVRFIHANAFAFCDNLIIRCYKGSYAHEYAKEHNINYELID